MRVLHRREGCGGYSRHWKHSKGVNYSPNIKYPTKRREDSLRRERIKPSSSRPLFIPDEKRPQAFAVVVRFRLIVCVHVCVRACALKSLPSFSLLNTPLSLYLFLSQHFENLHDMNGSFPFGHLNAKSEEAGASSINYYVCICNFFLLLWLLLLLFSIFLGNLLLLVLFL